MVSLVSKGWLNKEFCNTAIQSIKTFIGEGSDISLKAANNTEVNIEGVVTLSFSLQNSGFNFAELFIVTKEEILNLILGFNVIEHPVLTKNYTVSQNIFLSLESLKIESVSNVIKNRNRVYGSVYNST